MYFLLLSMFHQLPRPSWKAFKPLKAPRINGALARGHPACLRTTVMLLTVLGIRAAWASASVLKAGTVVKEDEPLSGVCQLASYFVEVFLVRTCPAVPPLG